MSGLLDGYELRLRWEWTNGGPANALQLLHDFIYTEPRVLMTWGPALSSEAIVVNEVAARYNLIQIGLANSPTLGGQSYPLTIRIWEEENEVNPARVALMRKMNWSRCGLIFDESSFRQHFDDLAELLRTSGISVVAMETVQDVTQSQEQIKSLRQHDARIIFMGFYQEAAKYIFCQIYNSGLRGPKYVWVVPGWYAAEWWLTASVTTHGCSAEQLEQLLLYHIFVSGVQIIDDVNRMDYQGFRPQLDQTQRAYLEWLRSQSIIDNNWATLAYAYDALFVIALALNSSIADLKEMIPPRRLDAFDFSDREMTQVFLRNAEAIDVYGITDHLVIGKDRARDFTEYVYIEQSQGNGSYVKVAKYDAEKKSVTLLQGKTFMWSGNDPPVDGITEIEEWITVPLASKVPCYLLSALGTLLALFFLTINIRYRQKRAIKLSSPMLNNLIVGGCLFLYASVFVFGLDVSQLKEGTFITVCFIETTLLCIGISLAFGALFLKTYRIHLVWTNSMRHAKRIEISDTKLMAGVASMVTVDVIIILLWVVVDTTNVTNVLLASKLDESNPIPEVYKVPMYRECTSDNQIVFIAIIYAIKGLLMLGGSFLAWEMRRITIAELNDSRFIIMSIYVVVLTLAITVPTLTVLAENRGLYFTVRSLAIIVANTAVLCLVFVPKVALFLKTKDGELKLHFGRDQMSGSKSPGSTLNMGPGQTSGLMDKLVQKHRELSELNAQLTLLLANKNIPSSKDKNQQGGRTRGRLRLPSPNETTEHSRI
ncbi:gamma-aminobutyric acid type B receptor subunit 2-like [Patiria miniata]|uniref:Gamma-aminobutyric acid type B receptor subunit 2 n=1 Tax=Patiria miniata TaxID=46514 RepID=A0A914BKZ2_PATMI|nr:gamma-aminobutyric acid type B receptor subunit 2-like [Patiria miniata]